MFKRLKKQVEHCLEVYEEARNSDQFLFNAILVTFYKEHLKYYGEDNYDLPLKNYYLVPSGEYIGRVRRRIQNPRPKDNYFGKYPPTRKDVLKKRGWMEEEVRKFV